MTSPAVKADALRRLHERDSFLVLPNAWDAGSARLLEASGFPAVATSSAGVAAAYGYADGSIPPDDMLAAVSRIARAVQVPVTADLEDAYAAPGELDRFISRVIATGVVGLNIEDVRRDSSQLTAAGEQTARIRAIRAAASRLGVPLVINARTDVFLRQIGPEDQREAVAIDRGNAFLAAGADCVFVPGVIDSDRIRRLVAGIRGAVNILAVAASPPLELLRALGVRRVSLGSGPARVALTALRDLVAGLKTDGRFERLGGAMTYDEVNQLMGPHAPSS